jgi:SAM-dependent methyltransferase
VSELLIGCGSSWEKKIYTASNKEWRSLVTLDINADHKPDIVWDLNNLPLPFKEDAFDEIHAYEVLEHVGAQGDYKTLFAQFTEFHRILKPKGKFFATVPTPTSPWAWGDPSHTRIFCKEWLTFLRQKTYEEQVGKTSLSDFRYLYKADFDIVVAEEKDNTLYFILEAIK